MDRRLVTELLPGPAFLVGNALGGLFAGAGAASVATAAAVVLRWRWDGALPWLAISIFGLTLVLLGAGLALDDATFVKVSNTVGSLAFAGIVAVGALLRPSLLQRSLGHSLAMTPAGWRWLHVAWIAVSLARAAANEAMWRNVSDGVWAIYNGVADVAWIGVFFLVTSAIARRHWNGPAD